MSSRNVVILLFCLLAASVVESTCMTASTADNERYDTIFSQELGSSKAVTFTVLASNDAHVGFFSSSKSLSEVYEIVIGGWSNSKSVIRNNNQGRNQVQASTSNIVSSSEAKQFWASASNGLVQFGHGSVIGEQTILSWQDPNPHEAVFIGVMTGWGSTGSWNVCMKDAGISVAKVGDKKMCKPGRWLHQFPESAMECASLVLADPSCDNKYFSWANYNDNNCMCARVGTDCPSVMSDNWQVTVWEIEYETCQDHEGLIVTLNQDYTCDDLREQGDSGDCGLQMGQILDFYAIAGIQGTLGSGITRDMYVKDICPNVYKDHCRTCASGPEYIGCFDDNGHRDLDGKHAGRVFSVDDCNSACEDFAFFGLQHYREDLGGSECRCGNNYGIGDDYSQVDDAECAKQTGLDGARSGGGWKNAVYSVQKTFNFQLRGDHGNEIVTITDRLGTRTRAVSTSWQTFSASSANIVIRFTNDLGPNNVYFVSNTPADIRSDARFAQWNCDTSDRERCDAVRNGEFKWTADYQIEFKNAAYWKTCRWQSTQDQSGLTWDGDHLMGWTCGDNEILTGFEISNGNLKDVSKVQCCELGGHSSVVPNTCTFVGITDERDFAQTATCDGNEHRVFIGAYDTSKSSRDAYNELNVGKCCEVKCDAQWCSGKDWGVNDRQCRTIYADRENMQPQDLVCPEGTLMTKIHDHDDTDHRGSSGIQLVAAVECCELHVISQPTKAPSAAPTTSEPTPSPTTAPTPSPTNPPSLSPTKAPSPSPTTAPSPSPTTAPSPAPTSTSDCLLTLFASTQKLSDAEILQGIQDCLPDCQVPQSYYRRVLEGRLLSENSQ